MDPIILLLFRQKYSPKSLYQCILLLPTVFHLTFYDAKILQIDLAYLFILCFAV